MRKTRVIKLWADQKNYAPSSNLISSHRSLKWRSSQHMYAEDRVLQIAFTIHQSNYSQFALREHTQ